MPKLSSEWKPNPEPLTSGDSDFESATGSPAPEPTRNLINTIEGGPQVETEQTQTEQVKLIEGGPQIDFEEHNPLVKSSLPNPNPTNHTPLSKTFLPISKTLTNPFQSTLSLCVRFWFQMSPKSGTIDLSSERTWIQLVCCALVSPNVLICREREEELFRERDKDKKRKKNWLGRTKLIFRLELQQYRVQLYIWSRKVRPNRSYKRKQYKRLKVRVATWDFPFRDLRR
jgi:hypothetical protein